MEKDRIRNLLRDEELARRDFMRPQLLELGLTVGQGQPRILLNLLRYGPQTQKKLSDRCRMDVTTMSRTLDRMETSGFVAREDNPGCRRSYLIRLTSQDALAVKGRIQGTVDEHRQYLDALKAGDGPKAYQIMIHHLMMPLKIHEKETHSAEDVRI